MALYNSTIQILKKDDYAKELYRFQGSNSYNCIKSNTIDNNGYLYFSNSLDHHKYFTLKRIKQLLAKELQELDLSLSLQYLHDPKTYHQIKRLIINSERIRDLYSYRLIYDTNYLSLIKDNYFYQEKKPSSSNIERVDRRVFGGGYGVKDEWKDLLSYLTLFISKQEITREDVLTLLSNMKKTNKINYKNNLDHIISINPSNIALSDYLKSDFTKYDIMNTLELIIEKGLYNPNSDLAKEPTKTIKEVVSHYQKTKEKTLLLLK